MTTKPISAEEWCDIWVHQLSPRNYFDVKDSIVSVLEQRDQELTAPLMERIRVLEEALKFYADDKNWVPQNDDLHDSKTGITIDIMPFPSMIKLHGESIARIALQTTAEGEV